jgi:type II secretory pathway pseudopilin PulG
MRKIKNSNSGYTLIELLAVMIVLTTVGVIIASIFVSALRGGNKSTTTNDIRQSGNYAISQMSKMIAFAKNFGGVNSAATGTFTTDCAPRFDADGKLISPLQWNDVKITSFDNVETSTTFSCEKDDTNTYGILSSKSADLVTPALINSVALLPDTVDATTCFFTCSQPNLASPITININLTLQRRIKAGSTALPESQTVIPFNTSVTLRNSL